MSDTIEHEKIKELEELLGLISKDIEIVGKEFSKILLKKVYSPAIIDLSNELSVSVEYRRHIETMLVDLRRFLDKVVFTYLEIKNWTAKIKNDKCNEIAFPFSDPEKKFEKLLDTEELLEFQKTKLWNFFELKKNYEKDRNQDQAIEMLNGVYRTSHRGLTAADVKSCLIILGMKIFAGAVIDCSNFNVITSKREMVLVESFKSLDNSSYRIEFMITSTFSSGRKPYLNMAINQETFYKDMNVMSLLRDSHALAKGALEAMKGSL